PPQIARRIEHFVGRKAMDIEGLGGETIEVLLKAGLIQGIADLYDLHKEQLLGLGKGWGEKSAQSVIDGIAASRAVPFDRVLFALGIRHVGETIARKIARSAGSMDRLLNMSKEEMTAIEEVGEVVADSMHAFLAAPQNRTTVERLRDAGLRFEVEATAVAAGDQLKDLTFVVSGVFENFSRDGIKQAIESHGGKVSGSISKKTNFVLAGADMGPAKRAKADDLGVAVIDEKEFMRMIGRE
ncbi:MAG: NAD-dependent DNA ligase LigA, partial [Flavobacteriales bacterium]|nr:NAD-dependent DNA ligase LigA [Flavobacteriales bacterium]